MTIDYFISGLEGTNRYDKYLEKTILIRWTTRPSDGTEKWSREESCGAISQRK